MTVTVEVGGARYRVGRMNAMTQFHVGRRLAPVLAILGLKAASMIGEAPPTDDKDVMESFVPLLAPLAEVLARMSDEDSNYVVERCMLVTEREITEGKWQMVVASGSSPVADRFMFQDIDLHVMLRLVLEAIRENLAGFMTGLGDIAQSLSS